MVTRGIPDPAPPDEAHVLVKEAAKQAIERSPPKSQKLLPKKERTEALALTCVYILDVTGRHAFRYGDRNTGYVYGCPSPARSGCPGENVS